MVEFTGGWVSQSDIAAFMGVGAASRANGSIFMKTALGGNLGYIML